MLSYLTYYKCFIQQSFQRPYLFSISSKHRILNEINSIHTINLYDYFNQSVGYKMLQFKNTEKKQFKPGGESRRQLPRLQSLDFLENSNMRPLQRNDNINIHLITNFNQIRQLLRERKGMLKSKYQLLLVKNKQRINSIANAKDHDLRNQAKLLNDPSILNLLDHAESLGKSKSLLFRISQTNDMNGFSISQMANGKRFWDRHKQFQRQKKRKAQIYTNCSKQLKDLNQKERAIFFQIQRCQNQIVNLLFRNRDDPNHIKRAQLLNQQVQKRKNMLKDIRTQKAKLKSEIQQLIDQILEFNQSNEQVFKKRYKQLDEVFLGSENLGEIQNLMEALQRIIVSKTQQSNKYQNAPAAAQNLGETFRNYDIVIQEVQKLKEDEDQIFSMVNDELRQNIKNAVMEKAFLAGVPIKQDQGQLLRKCKQYKKLLFELNEDRPRLQAQLHKVNSMSNMLYPIKKAYATENVRREDLKRQIKRLCSMNLDLQAKEKELRNFQFDMEDLVHKRRAIEAEINDSAEKVNLGEYKNKMRELQNINKKIGQKNDAVLNEQLLRLRQHIENEYNHMYDQYEDLINEVEMNEQQPSLGVFLTKLEKRLSLV